MEVKTGDKIRETFHEESDDGFAENKDTVLQTVNSGQYGSCLMTGNQHFVSHHSDGMCLKRGRNRYADKDSCNNYCQNEQADYGIYSFLGWGR